MNIKEQGIKRNKEYKHYLTQNFHKYTPMNKGTNLSLKCSYLGAGGA